MVQFLTPFEPVILVVHFLICVFLVIVILLQAGKGADMGAAFGAGSSQTLFGARGAATFLQKMTAVVAISFLVTSLALASIHKNRSAGGGGKSVVDQPVPATPPVVPAQQVQPAQAQQQPVQAQPAQAVTEPEKK